MDLSPNYIRDYSQRRKFSLFERPKNIPFGVFAYFRQFQLSILEETDDPTETEANQMNFAAQSMFNFAHELVIHNFRVLSWDLQYCLF